MDISIIIPCFNEEENIPALLTALEDYVENLSSISCEVIFVDDGSTDNTLDLLRKATHKGYEKKIIKFSRNFGSHAALTAAVAHAQGNYTTFVAADLQTPLENVGRLYRKCLEGYDLVVLERKSSKDPFLKKVLSKIYAGVMRRFVASNYPDKGFDVIIFNHKVRQELAAHTEKNASLLLQMLQLGFKRASISSDKEERVKGSSRWTFWKNIKLLVDSLVGYSYAPVRVIMFIGVLLFVLGILGIFFLDNKILTVLLIGFGLTNLSLSIIGEYLWRTYEAAQKRSPYVIDEIIS